MSESHVDRVTADILPAPIDYRIEEFESPRYKWTKLSMDNQQNPLPVFDGASASTILVQFKLPQGVMNLSRSIIQKTVQYVKGADGTFNWIRSDCIPFNQTVFLGNDIGPAIVNLENAQNHTMIVRKAKTKKEDFMHNDPSTLLFPSNKTAITNFRGVAIDTQLSIYTLCGVTSAASYYGDCMPDAEQHYIIGPAAVTNPSAVGGVTLSVQYPLSVYKDTYLDMDMDSYFPTVTYLRLSVGNCPKWGHNCAKADDPTDTPVNLGAITVSSMYLWVAMEQNRVLIDTVMDKYKNGKLRIQYPFTQCWKNVVTGPTFSPQIQISANYGKRLKSITTAVFGSTETKNTNYDCDNFEGGKISYYQTYLDNEPIQANPLYCGQNPIHGTGSLPAGNVGLEDYRYNRLRLKDSILDNAMSYQLNWHHSDVFGEKVHNTLVPEHNIEEGLEMDKYRNQNLLYAIQATGTATTYNFYSYVVFLRELLVTPDGYVAVGGPNYVNPL